ncbi:DNA gyrase subunit A [candidate division WWE3 bacterium]|uniref:DNA gyrase subunit A n=1 Tax=candidate division WWE3 bacterium TaxID=2053526 RepID=A0A7X9HSQ1_UNCKA|nr:DNA gyrase subunit A [candidate division WWE3 bacterium]
MADEKEIIKKEEVKENPNILKTEITTEMQSSYLDYAMSVIVSRALPDVRDGLKPVQRRIIYSMQEQGMSFSGKFHKCASVVGGVLAKYHPHGETSVYDALVRMGQDFTLRYPLVKPQGNFGSIDDDPPAAMRYTECKLEKISEELFSDIDKETVDFMMNDLQNQEPLYLPSLLPNLLLNGVSGIAVGMATSIPPHNLGEIIDGINILINKANNIGTAPKKGDENQVMSLGFSSDANVEDLTNVIQGPDFPTGGIIYDHKEIVQMYATGRGKIITRAKVDTEEGKNGKVKLIVTEIPYMVNKSLLIAKIADLIKERKIAGIGELRDESNKEGLRIAIELKRDAVPNKIKNQLYKYTQLQNTFNSNFVALLNNEPKLMTLKNILEEFIIHRQQVVIRRTLYLLKKAEERAHILRGLKIALDNLDEVIKLIKSSKDADAAKEGLMKKFKLSEVQSQAILDMQLRRLAALERKKIEDELKEVLATIEDYKNLLASPKRVIGLIKDELNDVKKKYSDERKTKVIKGKVGELSEEDLVVEEPCIVTISEGGYIKRLKETAYKKQGRGGKGVKGQELKEEDSVDTIKICSTHDWAFFFTNTGKVYKLRIWEIPETTRNAKGTPLINFLNMKQEERVEAFLTKTSEELESKEGFIFFTTAKGVVKKTAMEDFENIRTAGIIAITLEKDDYLVFVDSTSGDDDVLLTTAMGQSIRFSEKDVRAMGRSAKGVTGIKLSKKSDSVVGTVIIPKKSRNIELLVVSDMGYGKKTPVSEYKTQKRAGSGILTYKVKDKTGALVAARTLEKDKKSDVLIATVSGKIIRLSTNQIPSLGRATQGVRLMKLNEGDKAASVAVMDEEIETEEE